MTGGSEFEHQRALFMWAAVMERSIPELRWLHATLNGMAARSATTAAKAVAQGNRRGIPDVFLDVPRGGFHGLRIELKRPGKHSVSPEQREWIEGYNQRGYHAVICVGWEAARNVILGYLEGAKA